MTTHKKEWTVSDLTNATLSGQWLEIRDRDSEWQSFAVYLTPTRAVIGCACNVGFLESGYIERDEGETDAELLQELLADLETYYNDGPQYVSRLVCNERM